LVSFFEEKHLYTPMICLADWPIAIQKENEIRKAVIRTQRWRLRIKLQKDNTDKQPTVPEKNTYNSRSKYDREKKEQSALQLASQPNKSWE
jgi:hypothetical protein